LTTVENGVSIGTRRTGRERLRPLCHPAECRQDTLIFEILEEEAMFNSEFV
jgi:hypothetical protein